MASQCHNKAMSKSSEKSNRRASLKNGATPLIMAPRCIFQTGKQNHLPSNLTYDLFRRLTSDSEMTELRKTVFRPWIPVIKIGSICFEQCSFLSPEKLASDASNKAQPHALPQ